MQERNIINGFAVSVLSPFIGMLEKIKGYGMDDDNTDIKESERTPLRNWRGVWVKLSN